MAVFGLKGWLRFHRGAVGAVRVLPEKMQVGYTITLPVDITFTKITL